MFNQQTKQGIFSTGNETLDKFLGGGLVNSSLNLFERQGPSSRILDAILTKTIASTTLKKKLNLIFINFNSAKKIDNESLLTSLPANRDVKSDVLYKDIRGSSDSSQIKIAWRYTQRGTSSPSDAFHRVKQVDFGLSLSKESTLSELGILKIINVDPLQSLLSLSTAIENEISASGNGNTAINVIVKDLLNPLSAAHKDQENLLKFTYLLRCFSRRLNGGTISLCFDRDMWMGYDDIRDRLYSLVDSVVTFYSYETDENKLTGYKDIDGTLNYLKVPKINSLGFHFQQDISDWGYRITKNYRFFVIDELSLPPCDSIDASSCSTRPKTEFKKIENIPRPLERANPLEEFKQVAQDILPRRL